MITKVWNSTNHGPNFSFQLGFSKLSWIFLLPCEREICSTIFWFDTGNPNFISLCAFILLLFLFYFQWFPVHYQQKTILTVLLPRQTWKYTSKKSERVNVSVIDLRTGNCDKIRKITIWFTVLDRISVKFPKNYCFLNDNTVVSDYMYKEITIHLAIQAFSDLYHCDFYVRNETSSSFTPQWTSS